MTDTRAPELISIASIFTGIAVIVVILRFYAKARTQGTMGWDDFFIFFSIVCGVTDTICVLYAVSLGFGRHTADVLAEPGGAARAVTAAKIQMIAYPFNILSFTVPNVAIAILIHKCLDDQLWRTRLLWTMCVTQVVLALIPCIVIYVQCQPIQKLWNTQLAGSCWDSFTLNNITYFMTAYTILFDVVLAVMPIRVFWKLQLPRKTKILLSVMMSLTLLSAVTTTVKATYLYLFTNTEDPLWDVVILVDWGLVEQNVVIVAACVPPVRRIFANGSRHGTTKGSKNTPRSGSKSFKLSGSFFKSRSSKNGTLQSSTDIPLTDQMHDSYIELDSSKGHPAGPGIMRTVGVSVLSEVASSPREDVLEEGYSIYTGPEGDKGHNHSTAVAQEA